MTRTVRLWQYFFWPSHLRLDSTFCCLQYMRTLLVHYLKQPSLEKHKHWRQSRTFSVSTWNYYLYEFCPHFKMSMAEVRKLLLQMTASSHSNLVATNKNICFSAEATYLHSNGVQLSSMISRFNLTFVTILENLKLPTDHSKHLSY